MKRTDMLNKIEGIFAMYRHIPEMMSNKAFAELLLNILENNGMKPPHISEEASQAAMHLYYAGFSYYQWDEDLVKDEKLQAELKRRAEWDAKTPEEKKAIRQARREARIARHNS